MKERKLRGLRISRERERKSGVCERENDMIAIKRGTMAERSVAIGSCCEDHTEKRTVQNLIRLRYLQK